MLTLFDDVQTVPMLLVTHPSHILGSIPAFKTDYGRKWISLQQHYVLSKEILADAYRQGAHTHVGSGSL
jgi:hypothetical protein